MNRIFKFSAVLAAHILSLAPLGAASHGTSGPLRIEITEGVIEPLPIAVPSLVADNP